MDKEQGSTRLTAPRQQNVPPRIVVVESVYHQQEPDPATMVESRFSRFLTSEDSPLVRRTTIGEEWAHLSCAGIETQGSMLVIQNLEGMVQARIPSADEKEKLNSRVLCLGISLDDGSLDPFVVFATVAPGESIRLSPSNLKDYRIKCMSGKSRYALALFPL